MLWSEEQRWGPRKYGQKLENQMRKMHREREGERERGRERERERAHAKGKVFLGGFVFNHRIDYVFA